MPRKSLFFCPVVIAVLALQLALADEPSKKPENKQNPTAKSQKMPALSSTVRVSTDAVLSRAAKEEAKKNSSDKAEKDPADKDILEFRPAAPDSNSRDKDTVVVPGSKQPPLKNVHGEVYGTSGRDVTGTRAAGAAVGASSKSGKSSIYVETQRSRTTPAH